MPTANLSSYFASFAVGLLVGALPLVPPPCSLSPSLRVGRSPQFAPSFVRPCGRPPGAPPLPASVQPYVNGASFHRRGSLGRFAPSLSVASLRRPPLPLGTPPFTPSPCCSARFPCSAGRISPNPRLPQGEGAHGSTSPCSVAVRSDQSLTYLICLPLHRGAPELNQTLFAFCIIVCFKKDHFTFILS